MATYNKIQVEDKNEGEKIAWAQSKTKIIFGDDDLAIRCDTRQRDIPVTVDVCMDDQNNLTIGTGTGRYYVAQVEIPAQKFVEVEEKAGGLDFVTEHKLGDGKGASQELWEGLNNHFMGECSEVGQYLAMARQADREGYPEIAEAFKRYAWEEAEHASKFAELIGDIVWDTKTNLFKRMNAECGACEDKMRLARLAKEQNLDAVHDTVHEMAKDEARHGSGFQGLYNRYFKA